MDCTAPFTTRLTLPVVCSSTRKSLSPKKAMLVGVIKPEITVRRARFSSSTIGGGTCGPTIVSTLAEFASTPSAVTVAGFVVTPQPLGLTTVVKAGPPKVPPRHPPAGQGNSGGAPRRAGGGGR